MTNQQTALEGLVGEARKHGDVSTDSRGRVTIEFDNHGLAAFVAALAAQGAGWRPIESAPRDGTHILLGYIGSHSEEGFWMGDASRNHWNETGWYATGEDVLCEHPSHPELWQPLPAAPQAQPAQGRDGEAE